MGFSVALITLLLAGYQVVSGAVAIKCKFLVSLENGSVKYESDTTQNSVGGIVNFVCDEKFKLSGAEKRTCLDDGEWDGIIPTCVDIRCPFIMGLQDGTMTKSCDKDPADPGCTMTFKCDNHFKLIGANKLTCGDNAEWDFLPPKCIENHCPHIVQFPHGKVEGYENPPLPGTKIEFSCCNRYKLTGAKILECGDNLMWDQAIPQCDCDGCTKSDKARCPTVVSFPLGTYKINGKWLKFKGCIDGYHIPFGQRRALKCRNGVWGTFPTCENSRCPHWEAIRNGKVEGSKYDRHSRIKVTCDEGYIKKGTHTLRCKENRKWGPGTTKCYQKHCPAIPDFPNGQVSNYDTSPGSRLSFTCDEGYTMEGQSTIVCRCTKDQGILWLPDIPKCIPK